MDAPLQKTIRIGNATVGLLGLNVALAQLSGKEALRREYRRYFNMEESVGQGLTIRVLGRPCVTCNKLKTMLIDILHEKGVAADIEDVQDLDEIWRYGVTKTPALIINGKVKSAGIQPPRVKIEQWIEEAIAE